MKKHILHILLPVMTMVMILCFRTQPANAAVIHSGTCVSDDNGNNITWTLDDAGCFTLNGTGATPDYRTTINGQDTILDTPWKAYNNDIKHIFIGDGITYVGMNAFSGLMNLESIDCGETLEIIGVFAFSDNSNLTDINLRNVSRILQGGFQSCNSIKSLYIPGTMRIVDFDAFSYDSSLETVYIDKSSDESIPFLSVSGIAFKYCTSLTSVTVNPERTDLISIDGVLYSVNMDDDLIITGKDTYELTDGKYVLICYPCGKTDKEYVAPDKLEAIACASLPNSHVEKIILNEGLKIMSSCQTRYVPNVYSGIRGDADYTLDNLKELVIPSTVIDADCKIRTSTMDKITNNSSLDISLTCYSSDVCNHKFASLTTNELSDTIKAKDTFTALKHSYGEWVVTLPATTYSEGTKTRTCSVCGHEDEEKIPQIDNSKNGVCCSEDGIWYYYIKDAIQFDYTGLASNEYGWFYIRNGELDWNYTGLASNEYGWFYVSNGVLDWSYTGLASNEYGWFYINNGMLDWSYTGLASNEYGWFYINNGVLDWNYTGLASNEYGWFYINNGVLDWNYTGLASNEYGWFYINNGVLDWSYTGLANNEYGWFYISNGVLDWSYTGTASNEYGTWNVVNGQVVF